jgi:hypothetical protein
MHKYFVLLLVLAAFAVAIQGKLRPWECHTSGFKPFFIW